jgi:hypothetical protein
MHHRVEHSTFRQGACHSYSTLPFNFRKPLAGVIGIEPVLIPHNFFAVELEFVVEFEALQTFL